MHRIRLMPGQFAQAILNAFANDLETTAQCSSLRILLKRLGNDAETYNFSCTVGSTPKQRQNLTYEWF